MGFRSLTVAAVLVCWALPLEAQQTVELKFDAGLVTLRTQNASARAVLAEWARLGGATIVNGDHVAGPPLTIELTGVPEQQALDIILRSTAGYVLAPRRAATDSTSAFDRILILATSAAPSNPPPPPVAPPAALPMPGVARPVLRQPPIIVRQPQANVETPNGIGTGPGGSGFDPLGQVPQPVAPPGAEFLDPAGMPGGGLVPEPTSPAGVAPSPSNPFGIPFGSSATPGVVTPVPQPQEQPPGPNGVQ